MITLEDFETVPTKARGAFVAIGNFDGVHRGHAHLLARLKARAQAAGVPALALTFDPPPVAVLRPDAAPAPLTWLDRRLALMKSAGADEVGIFKTGPWLLGLTAREFFDRMILEQLGARRGWSKVRPSGSAATGAATPRSSEGGALEAGLEFEVASPTEADGLIVSSTRISRALAEGDAERGHAHCSAGRTGSGESSPTEPVEEPGSASRRRTSTTSTP